MEYPKNEMKCMADLDVPCEHFYCQGCIFQHLTQLIMDGRVRELKCPFPTCGMIPDTNCLKGILNEEMFTKYREFSVLSDLRNNPNARWCPIKTCSSAILCEPDEIKDSLRVVCPKCEHQFCFDCNEPFHGTTKCNKKLRDEESEENNFKLYLQNLKEKIKPCPKCHMNIQKNEGCNHMTCVSCRHQFCWLCMGDYNGTHFTSGPCTGLQFTVADSLKEAQHLRKLERKKNSLDEKKKTWKKNSNWCCCQSLYYCWWCHCCWCLCYCRPLLFT